MPDPTCFQAFFPASCVPALAAFQGSGPFSAPDPQRDFSGARIAQHPDRDDWVQLVATDSSNLLCLIVSGSCRGGPFAFDLPEELVRLCSGPPLFTMWAEGSKIAVAPPPWMVPGDVILVGHKYEDPKMRTLGGLTAFVSGKAPHPSSDDLGLGGLDLRFGPSQLLAIDLTGIDEPADVAPSPISAGALLKLGKLVELFPGQIGPEDPTLEHARGRQIWRFGKSWAITMADDTPEGRMALEGVTEEDIAETMPPRPQELNRPDLEPKLPVITEAELNALPTTTRATTRAEHS